MSMVLDGTGGITTNSGTLLSTSDATISGLTVGKGGGSVSTATVVGNGAMAVTNTGAYNAAFGTNASNSNTSGGYNTAIGAASLYTNSTGSYNTAIGMWALQANSTANNNTAVGYTSQYSNSTGTLNTSVGMQTMYQNTTGSNNIAIGAYTYAGTTGSNNTVVGQGAMSAGTCTGSYNSAYGLNALSNNSSGTSNVGIGVSALYSNTTASYNTAVGYQALYSSNRTSNINAYNVAVGYQAGYNQTTGQLNTFIGPACGSAVTTGGGHSIIGAYDGYAGGALDIRTASNYIVLSDGAGNARFWSNGNGDFIVGTARTSARGFLDIPTIGGTGSVCLAMSRGGDAGAMVNFYATNSTTTPIGNIYNTGGTNTQYNTSSDYRLKENITPMTGGLDKLSALKPVNWNWKSTGADGQGFIAHELAEVCPHAVSGVKDEVDADGNPVYQGVDTSYLVVTLTAAMQELKAIVDAQAAEIAELKAKVM